MVSCLREDGTFGARATRSYDSRAQAVVAVSRTLALPEFSIFCLALPMLDLDSLGANEGNRRQC